MEVSSSAQGLGVLRERMEQDLWKTVLKGEAAMLEKESALNEIQRQREKLWAQREALVASLQQELSAEQERMAQAWKRAREDWEALKDEHNELRSQLSQRAVDIDQLQQRVASDMADAVNQLHAERQMVAQERNLCRDERSALSRSLIEHRSDVTKQRDKMFTSMAELAAEKERVVHASTIESAKLDQQKRAADLLLKNSKLERAVAAKERAAVSGLVATFQQEKELLHSETERLREAAAAVESRAQQVEAERSEAERHKSQAEVLALQTASQAQRLDEQQRQLKAQAAELLKSTAAPAVRDVTSLRPATAELATRGGDPVDATGPRGSARDGLASTWCADYTASALQAFPLSRSSQTASTRRAQIEETLVHLNARLGDARISLGASLATHEVLPASHDARPAAPTYAFAECI
jgi:chromosome segregation ATPase